MVYAMARDGGTPYHRQLSQLNDQQIPGNAVFATFLLAVGVVLPYPLSDDLFVVIISAATITIYSTYAVALGCKLFVGMGGKKGPFHLGPFSKPITALAFAWSLFTVVAFTLPTSWPIDGK
jgi:amino acid transporter